MSMKTFNQQRVSRRERGVALIVALILLMVLTMIAVVAMRTTTLDLKITTNQTLGKRTFQISEAGRAKIWDILNSHNFYRGWPAPMGDVPASSGFTIPDEITIVPQPGYQQLYFANNADHWDLRDAAIDMTLRIDADGDDAYLSVTDLAADIFISRMATVVAAGSDTSQVTGYEGLGAGAAGAGSHLFFRIVSRANGAGGSEAVTESIYRYVITN